MDQRTAVGASIGKIVLRLLLIVLALTPLALSIFKEWPQLLETFRGIDWWQFAVGQMLLLPIMLLVGSIPWASLRHLGVQFSYRKATRIYFFTQILKYLPGGFWAFPGRMTVYRFLGVDRAKAIVSVFRETTAFFLGAAAVGLLGLLQGLQLASGLRWAIGLGLLASGTAVVLTQMPWVWRFLSSFRLFTSSAYSEIDPGEINLSWLPPAFLGSFMFYLAFGIPFRQILLAASNGGIAISWVQAASIFALAWCAGFVVLIVPAGIGVRESALAFLLGGMMSASAALGVALLARLIWVLAEGFWILVTLIWSSRGSETSWSLLRNMRDSQTQ